MNTPKISMKRKRSPSKFTEEEKRKFYEQIAGSARVSENKKAYRRSRKAKRGEEE